MKITCPICEREYDLNPKKCACGFDSLSYPVLKNGEAFEEKKHAELFRIYKFAKRVFLGEVPFDNSLINERECDARLIIDWVRDNRGLVLIDRCFEKVGRQTVADEGVLAFKTNAKALILNVDKVHSNFLDESCVAALFFGKDVKDFRNGFFLPRSSLRYLTVHSGNANFCSDNNVMFTKDLTRLLCYAPAKPEQEYRVPRCVNSLGSYSFYYTKNLNRLYLPHGIELLQNSMKFDTDSTPEIIYY